jgi:hypothetical protein
MMPFIGVRISWLTVCQEFALGAARCLRLAPQVYLLLELVLNQFFLSLHSPPKYNQECQNHQGAGC